MAGWDPMTPWHDYYDDLNLHFGATPSQIKSAYNALALNTHPDKTGIPDATDFIRVQKAYKKLSDEEFRMAYNKTYWNNKLQHDPAGFENFTRTKEYEEEEARRKNRSPPPIKPVQKYGEPGYKYLFGRPYVAWKKRMAAWRARHPEEEENQYQTPAGAQEEPSTPGPHSTAHGLAVQMTHPCSKERCKCRATEWKVQTGGADFCVFCMAAIHTGGSRCPGCEALACKTCLEQIVVLERTAFGGLGYRAQYRASGG